MSQKSSPPHAAVIVTHCVELMNKPGAPKGLNESQVNEIIEIISKNLHVLVSLKIPKSKQTEKPCVMFYILCKGVIPDSECAFPRTLGSYPVDVVDGF